MLCIIFTSSCSEQVHEDDLKKALPDSILNMSIKDCKETIEGCKKTITLNPNDTSNVSIYCWMASCKFQLKDYKGAIEDYTKAIEFQANCTYAIGNRACCKYMLGDRKGACEDWKKADALFSGDNDPYGFISKYCK